MSDRLSTGDASLLPEIVRTITEFLVKWPLEGSYTFAINQAEFFDLNIAKTFITYMDMWIHSSVVRMQIPGHLIQTAHEKNV